jgi:hypothetical protein
VIADGFDLARDAVLEFLDTFKVAKPDLYTDRYGVGAQGDQLILAAIRLSDLFDCVGRELLLNVARTSLRTKLSEEVCTLITQR